MVDIWAFDSGHGEFIDSVNPNSDIPVSSVNLLIYKEGSILDEECVGLDNHICSLDWDLSEPTFPFSLAGTLHLSAPRPSSQLLGAVPKSPSSFGNNQLGIDSIIDMQPVHYP